MVLVLFWFDTISVFVRYWCGNVLILFGRFGIGLLLVWYCSGICLVLFLYLFVCWYYFGIGFVLVWFCFGTVLVLCWYRFGIGLVQLWYCFGIGLVLFWYWIGSVFELFWHFFGELKGNGGKCSDQWELEGNNGIFFEMMRSDRTLRGSRFIS